MGNAFKIFLLGLALAGVASLLGRPSLRRPARQDDAVTPAPS